MRIKMFVVVIVAVGLLAAGAVAFNLTGSRAKADAPPAVNQEPAVAAAGCCETGDCCCPGAGLCCDPAAKAKAKSPTAVKAASCCETGDCCCPGQGSCCAPATAAKDGKNCCNK
jgi:hypothetical protein